MWQETRPLVFTSGYSWKEIPPEDGKVLFIFPLLINPFKKIQRDQADGLPEFSERRKSFSLTGSEFLVDNVRLAMRLVTHTDSTAHDAGTN